jgi:nitroreductase
VTRLRAARSADPAYRLAELSDQLRELLRVAHRVPLAAGAELAELRGTARRPYAPDGSLRLYGLFSEPVLTASGYAGAVTWTADARGRLHTVSDVAPGGPARAVKAADRAVRVGDTALTHRELSRAGLAVSGATVSEDGRLGAGAGVRAVRAPGAGWDGEPLDRLWAVPVAEQAARALDGRDGGHGLLFLDLTLHGTVREAAGVCLLADCGGVVVRLAAAHDHPDLPYRDNLRLLASTPGTRLRAVARLDPAPHPRALLLAVDHPTDAGARVDLGFDRLQRADLPAAAADGDVTDAPDPDQAPVHLLRRRVHQAVSAGRRALALPHDAGADTRRLRRHGLGTAAELLDHLHASAAARTRDPFGRLLAADPHAFARAWLAAAVYTDEVDRALCAGAWGADPPVPGASESSVSSVPWVSSER